MPYHHHKCHLCHYFCCPFLYSSSWFWIVDFNTIKFLIQFMHSYFCENFCFYFIHFLLFIRCKSIVRKKKLLRTRQRWLETKIREHLKAAWTPDWIFREDASSKNERKFEFRNVHDILSLSCCDCRVGIRWPVEHFFGTFWCSDSTARNGFHLSFFFFFKTLGALRWVNSTFISLCCYCINSFYDCSNIFCYPSILFLEIFLSSNFNFFIYFECWIMCANKVTFVYNDLI